MVFRHVYRLLLKLKPKSKSKSQSKSASQPTAQADGFTEIHPPGMLNHQIIESTSNTNEAESTPTQATDGPTQEPQSTLQTSPTKEHANDQQRPSQVRLDTRRYGQIFENSNRDEDTRSSSGLLRPDAEPSVSTKALFPPLPPFGERKRSCGGA